MNRIKWAIYSFVILECIAYLIIFSFAVFEGTFETTFTEIPHIVILVSSFFCALALAFIGPPTLATLKQSADEHSKKHVMVFLVIFIIVFGLEMLYILHASIYSEPIFYLATSIAFIIGIVPLILLKRRIRES